MKPKQYKVFGWASFFNDLGADIISPLWPAFVTVTLGASTTFLGFLDGLGDAIVAFSQLISGVLSDKLRRYKLFVWLGYFGGFLGRIGYALSAAPIHLIAPKILDRLGKMRESPRDALVAAEVAPNKRGNAYGFISSMDNAGAVIGILLSFVLVAMLNLGLQKIFLIAAIPSLVSVALVLFWVKRDPAETTVKHRVFDIRTLGVSKEFRKVFTAHLVFGLANMSYSFLLLSGNHDGLSLALLPIFYFIFTAVAAASSRAFGELADIVGPKKVLIAGFLLFSAALGLASAGGGIFIAIITFILYGLHKGALSPSQRSLVSSLAPDETRATALGGIQFAAGITAIPASLMVGLLWDYTAGPTIPFLIAAVLSLIAAVIIGLVKTTRQG